MAIGKVAICLFWSTHLVLVWNSPELAILGLEIL